MNREKTLAASAFRVTCLSFSVLLLVLTLFTHIQLVRTQNEIAGLEKKIACAENECVLLKIQTASSLSLEELERRAVQELGMRHPEPGQIVTIDYNE